MKGQKHSLRQSWAVCLALGALVILPAWARAQEPVPPNPPASAGNPPARADHSARKKYSHVNDFLIRGTVFNEKALSFPGVELRVRVVGQKKYRWETYSNSRGEFAVRVPQGSDYEMLVHVKGFQDQTKTVEAMAAMSLSDTNPDMKPVAVPPAP